MSSHPPRKDRVAQSLSNQPRSGIGLAAALKYAAIGMNVVIVDINEAVLDKAVKSIKAVPGVGEVWGLKVDVSKIDEVVAMREKVFDEFGEVIPSV